MNERDFAYWLHGFFEVSDPKTLDEKQVKTIKSHLDSLFTKKTIVVPEKTSGINFGRQVGDVKLCSDTNKDC